MSPGEGIDTGREGGVAWEEVERSERSAIGNVRGNQSGEMIGLAFSGGGIRSATFNLGVIQGLARLRLLSRFDYLSTVSGGGYIGAWLTSLVCHFGKEQIETGANAQVTPELERAIALTADGANIEKAEAGGQDLLAMRVREAVEHLRTFSNYLTPRTGVLGLDTMTGGAIYTRNLGLNLALILCFGVGIFLLPHLVRGVVDCLASPTPACHFPDGMPDAFTAYAWIAGIFSLVSMAMIGWMLGPNVEQRSTVAGATGDGRTYAGALACQMAGLGLAGMIWSHAGSAFPPLKEDYLGWALIMGSMHVAAWLATWIVRAMTIRGAGPGLRDCDWKSLLTWFLGAELAGAFCGLLLCGLFDLAHYFLRGPTVAEWWSLAAAIREFPALTSEVNSWIWLTLMPSLVMTVLSAGFCLQIAIARGGLSAHDAEVLGRLGGAITLLCGAWAIMFALCGFAAATVSWSQEWLAASGFAAWLGTTLAAVLLGKSDKTGESRGGDVWERVAGILPPLFMAGFMVVLALITQILVGQLTGSVDAGPAKPEGWIEWVVHHARQGKAWWPGILGIFAGLVAAGCVLSRYVDINLFSYHGFYRNRLARCYLGAARWASGLWNPHKITGLDPADDLAMRELAAGTGVQRPYHIVNTALNITQPKNTAWLQRQAAPFVFTPKWCGYAMPGTGGQGEKVFMQPAAHFGGDAGPPLSLAVTISGAAASPNMGYHSSPAMAFLLTLFNVRLGAWCGNPAVDGAWRHAGPRNAIRYLVSELLGITNERSPFVYLSDGGHFENLGIYELVRRRCKLIVACDAGADDKYQFEDLANAVRKCELDFGVKFAGLALEDFYPAKEGACEILEKTRQRGQHFTKATILYPVAGGEPEEGTLIYIKAALTGDESADIVHYAAMHPDFPHESTGDQWFDEQQFESYRKLGYHSVMAAAGTLGDALGLPPAASLGATAA